MDGLAKCSPGRVCWQFLRAQRRLERAHAESVDLQMSFSAQHWEGLRAILACSDSALRQVVQRWPGIAELTMGDVMHRLLCLKVNIHLNSRSGTHILQWHSAVAEV